MIFENYIKGLGSLAIPQRDSTDYSFNLVDLSPPDDFKESVFKIQDCGTGFLISKSKLIFEGEYKYFGLMLTAAHVLLNLTTVSIEKQTFDCRQNSRLETAYLLDHFLDTEEDYISESTKAPFCMPGDLAVLLITLKNNPNSEALDAEAPLPDSECYIAGYPQPPPPLHGFTPVVFPVESNPTMIADRIFHGYHRRIIYSHGLVNWTNQNLLEVSCNAVSGMSGSPIIHNGKYIGVFLGGPDRKN